MQKSSRDAEEQSSVAVDSGSTCHLMKALCTLSNNKNCSGFRELDFTNMVVHFVNFNLKIKKPMLLSLVAVATSHCSSPLNHVQHW